MRVIVSQVIVPCAIRVLGQHLVSSKLCALSPVSIYVLGALDRVHSTQRRIHSAVSRSTMPCPYVVRLPSTGKSQVLLCAATFKFRGHLSIAFSWSLAFSRPKNGPDRTAGRSRTAKTISHRSLTRSTTRRRRRTVHRPLFSASKAAPRSESPSKSRYSLWIADLQSTRHLSTLRTWQL